MEKISDEYDLALPQIGKVTAIDMYGVVESRDGYVTRDDVDPAFYSVYRIETGLHVCVGDFSDFEDAQEFADRLCKKYSVKMM